MPLLLAKNYDLIKKSEKTFLTAAVAAAATAITVRSTDIVPAATSSDTWADNDYMIIGEIGTENSEVMQVNGAITSSTSITIDRSGSAGGTRYAHSIDEPVYRTDFDRVEFARATTSTGTPTQLTLIRIQPDDIYTRYNDTVNTTGFGFVRWNNTASGGNSAWSDGIPYEGYFRTSLGRMIKQVRRHLNLDESTESQRSIEDEDIIEELNEKQRDVAHERLWPFYEDIFSLSRVAYQREYDIDDDVVLGKVHTVTVESEPLAKIDAHRFDILHWDTATTGEPTHFSVWNNQLRLYPNPSAAASTTTINIAGGISATATSITATSTSGFAPSGRIIIESEVIAYTNTTSTLFRGCTRGLEETTAATHANSTTVTERDIIYTANREPNELADPDDRTLIQDPAVLVYGVCMELAIGKLQNQVLHDRFKIKYDEALKKLRDKFGRKGTFSFYRIKDKDEVVSDVGRWVDPNKFPSAITS